MFRRRRQKKFFAASFEPRFSRDSAGEYYFAYPFSNVIYHLKDGKPRPWLEVDFGEKTLPYDEIRKMTDGVSYGLLEAERKYLGDIDELVFSDSMVAFCFSEEFPTMEYHTAYRALYDIAKGETVLYNNSTYNFTPDPDSRFPLHNLFFGQPIAADGDLWVYAIQPGSLQPEDLEVLRERVSPSITEDSNPLLFFVKESI